MKCTRHVNEISITLKDNGLKVTHGRLGLLDIFKHNKKPLTVKEIARLYKSFGKINLVTLYRNVESLAEMGIVKKLKISDKEVHYEIPHSHHHHLICTNCGKIADLENCEVRLPKSKVPGFSKIKEHSLEFFGLCNNCHK